MTLPLLSRQSKTSGRVQPDDVGILNCRYDDSLDHTIALRLSDPFGTDERHVAMSKTLPDNTHAPSEPPRGRLALVQARDVKLATSSELLIARTYVPHSPSVRMVLDLNLIQAARKHEYVRDIYTEQNIALPNAPVFLTIRKPVARAAVMLQFPSGRQFSLVFGFDRYPPNDSDGVSGSWADDFVRDWQALNVKLISATLLTPSSQVLLPGIWTRFHRGPQKLKDIIKLEPIHPHGRADTCKEPRKEGCPHLPRTASIALLPDGDLLDATIEQQHLLDEDVLMVRTTITQLDQLEAGTDAFAKDSVSLDGMLSGSTAATQLLSTLRPDSTPQRRS